MYISSFLTVSSLAALAVAQTTSYSLVTSTTSICAALPVLDSCIASTTAIIESCSSTDYGCQCQKYTDLVTYDLPPLPPTILSLTPLVE